MAIKESSDMALHSATAKTKPNMELTHRTSDGKLANKRKANASSESG
jgi:hypothetical protein